MPIISYLSHACMTYCGLSLKVWDIFTLVVSKFVVTSFLV